MDVMNIAIGIGTLLLGGWVLNTPATDDQSKATTTPQSPSAKSILPPGDVLCVEWKTRRQRRNAG